jgi:hypothetical protein
MNEPTPINTELRFHRVMRPVARIGALKNGAGIYFLTTTNGTVEYMVKRKAKNPEAKGYAQATEITATDCLGATFHATEWGHRDDARSYGERAIAGLYRTIERNQTYIDEDMENLAQLRETLPGGSLPGGVPNKWAVEDENDQFADWTRIKPGATILERHSQGHYYDPPKTLKDAPINIVVDYPALGWGKQPEREYGLGRGSFHVVLQERESAEGAAKWNHNSVEWHGGFHSSTFRGPGYYDADNAKLLAKAAKMEAALAKFDLRHSPVADEVEEDGVAVFGVCWDNGPATGEFSERFTSHKEAQTFGEDWRLMMVSEDNNPTEAEEAYTFSVFEVEVEVEVEVDAGELACETTPTINVTDPEAVAAELEEADAWSLFPDVEGLGDKKDVADDAADDGDATLDFEKWFA